MRFLVFLLLGVFLSANAESVSDGFENELPLWQLTKITESRFQAKTFSPKAVPLFDHAHLVTLNENLMHNLLGLNTLGKQVRAKTEQDNDSKQFEISLPLPNGEIINLKLVKNSVLPKRLAEKYPEINTYNVIPNNVCLRER